MMRGAWPALLASIALGACGTTHQLGRPVSEADVDAIQRAAGSRPLELTCASPPAATSTCAEIAAPPVVHPVIRPVAPSPAPRSGTTMRSLLRREGDALVFQSGAGEAVSIPQKDLRTVEVRNHLAGAGYGLLLGLVGGAAIGAALGSTATGCNDDTPCGGPGTRAQSAILYGSLLGAVGAMFGSMVGAAVGTSVRFQLSPDGSGAGASGSGATTSASP
jgi:hypothetical protein